MLEAQQIHFVLPTVGRDLRNLINIGLPHPNEALAPFTGVIHVLAQLLERLSLQ